MLRMLRFAGLSLLLLAGCPLLVSEAPSEVVDDGSSSSTGSSATRYRCNETVYTCDCVVDAAGSETSPYCFPNDSSAASIYCCASPAWPNEGQCYCVTMACTSVANDRCECRAQSNEGSDSCSASGNSCQTEWGCYDVGSANNCPEGGTHRDAPCAIDALSCPDGRLNVFRCGE